MLSSTFPEDQPVIRIRGARTHNLRNIDVDLPTGKLIVMTGVSGSGKSSLAFDTLFAEGQRRYLESVSVQTRTLLRQLTRPDVDEITGLAPTISVDQRVSSVPVRSTLATTTEIYDFLRLLYARAGTAHCTGCGQPVQRQSVDQILQQTLQLPERTRLMILSPMVRGRRGAHREVLERIARNGFVRARIDEQIIDISEATPLAPGKAHTIDAIVDRIVIKEGIGPRLRESIELACRESDGTCIISHETDGQWSEKLFSTRFSCPDCDLNFPTPEPRNFSFNSPWGACPECSGLGLQQVAVPNSCPAAPPAEPKEPESHRAETPSLQTRARRRSGGPTGNNAAWHEATCKACDGTRLQAFPRGITFLDMTLPEFSRQTVDAALLTVDSWIQQVCGDESSASRDNISADTRLPLESRLIAERTLPDIRARLKCLSDVGIGYLSLDRSARSLSGGEFQRARLAASLSSQLFGAHFVLDEPTSGLHPRDTQRLLKTLLELRNGGGTVIVVEHDEDIMRAADWLVDLGPGAGSDGGHLLFSGTPQDAELFAQSPTGDCLRKRCQEPLFGFAKTTVPDTFLKIRNARLHNLRNVTVDIPLRRLVGVSGVSGSGKSSLILGTLLPMLTAAVSETRSVESVAAEAHCDGIDGMEHIRRVVSLDQSPLGRSSRSCIATLCGLWDEVRRLFTKTREARAKGLSSKHFSFNSGEGRCPECRGTGIRNVRMSFLPDAVIPCPTCRGLRFTKAVCSIRFRGKSVADLLQMRVDEAAEFFAEFQRLHAILATFQSVGLGYPALGQPAATFSGGEAQRAKLASELAVPSREPTLYALDEPTSGLHPADVSRLIIHLRKLVESGHSVIVIEHQLDVIRAADWMLDIGPGSADRGGEVIFSGRPEQIVDCERSETAKVLC